MYSGKKERIFSALEVANICGVVNQTAINWIKQEYLKAFMTPGGQYRVYADDLYHFLESRGMRIPEELQTLLAREEKYNRLLIVEDDSALNKSLAQFFQKPFFSYTVYQAVNGFEAGRILFEQKPGAIILDINLPGIDGRELCRKIKGDPGYGNPIIIAINGLNDPDLEKLILQDGADAFLTKPFEPQALADKIQELIMEKAE